jgi:hypothetical protein
LIVFKTRVIYEHYYVLHTVFIPQKSNDISFNASVAGGIIMYDFAQNEINLNGTSGINFIVIRII